MSSLTFSLFSKLSARKNNYTFLTVGFFPRKSILKAPAWDFRPRRQTDISDVGETTGFRLFSAQSRTLFSPSLPDLCLTAPASWPTQKYRLFCGQISRAKTEAFDRRGTNLVWWQSYLKANNINQYQSLLYSWKFLPNSTRSHCLLWGQMTCNNETVSR